MIERLEQLTADATADDDAVPARLGASLVHAPEPRRRRGGPSSPAARSTPGGPSEQRQLAPKVSEAQAAELEQLLEQTQTDAEKFCQFFKVANLRELPLQDYERAQRMLRKKQNREATA